MFGPKLRDHATDLPYKVRQMGMRVALSVKYAQDELVLVDRVGLDSPKTRELHEILASNEWESVLFVTGARSPVSTGKDSGSCVAKGKGAKDTAVKDKGKSHLELAARNIQKVTTLTAAKANVYDMLKHNLLVMDREALSALEKKLRAY